MTKYPITTGAERAAFVDAMKAEVNIVCSARMSGTNFTVVIAEFPDGWQILGKSVCVSNADFNEQMGIDIAMKSIMDEADIHYWRTVGYMAKQGYSEIIING